MTTREQKWDHLRDLRKHDDQDLPTELDLVYDDLKQAQARIEALEAALRIIAGYDECFNGLSDQNIAIAALAPEQDK